MLRLLDAPAMREADNYTINSLGMPSMVLMERASLCVYEEIIKVADFTSQIGVLAGPGNNGGDAIAVARLLTVKGYNAFVYCPVLKEKMSKDELLQYEIAMNFGVSFVYDVEELYDCDILVDGLFGTGLTRDIDAPYDSLIDFVNTSDAYVISIDIPSGLSASTGRIRNKCVYADKTVAIAYIKIGEIVGYGAQYCGEIVVADIGIETDFIENFEHKYTLVEDDILNAFCFERDVDSNKSTCGKVLVIAGNDSMCGAAYLSANAAFSAGAGMVRIYTRPANKSSLNMLLPEAIVDCYETFDQVGLERLLSWSTAVVIGPGFGTDELSEKILDFVMHHAEVPVVIDADGINILAKNLSWLANRKAATILTPHNAEAARLCDVTYEKMASDSLSIISEFAKIYDATIVYKSHYSIIASRDHVYVVNAGSPALATAGSGDVLSGIIGQLSGEFYDYEAGLVAALGSYIHAKAGSVMADVLGVRGVKASDIVKGVNIVFSELETREEEDD